MNPYALYVHGEGKEHWEVGETCRIDLVLFGQGTEHAAVYLDALQMAERKGWGARRLSFRLLQITDPETGKIIYAGGKSFVRNLMVRPLRVQERNASCATILFDTPLRVVSSKELFRSLPFETLIRFLMRKIVLLTFAHTEYQLEWKEELLSLAQQIKLVEEQWREIPFLRFSMNQKDNKLELPAKEGWVLYEGNLSPFVPILEAGKYFHLGKYATIGFGHYETFYDQ